MKRLEQQPTQGATDPAYVHLADLVAGIAVMVTYTNLLMYIVLNFNVN
jgi:hypothetical protein